MSSLAAKFSLDSRGDGVWLPGRDKGHPWSFEIPKSLPCRPPPPSLVPHSSLLLTAHPYSWSSAAWVLLTNSRAKRAEGSELLTPGFHPCDPDFIGLPLDLGISSL